MQGQVRHAPDGPLGLLMPPMHWSNWVVADFQSQPLLYRHASAQPVQLDYGRLQKSGTGERWQVPDSGSNGNNPGVGARSWNPHNQPPPLVNMGVPVPSASTHLERRRF